MAKLNFSIHINLLPLSLNLLRRRTNDRNVSLTPYPTGEKHSISTFVSNQTHIQRTRRRRKTDLFKTSLPVFKQSKEKVILLSGEMTDSILGTREGNSPLFNQLLQL